MFQPLIKFIREQYRTNDFIPLHEPIFYGKEHEYVSNAINSTFVSSVGAYVDRFERDIANYTGSPKAVATVNGTSGLHIALLLSGVKRGEIVITQPLTFIATCNAISYCGAEPVFVDVDRHTLGMSPVALNAWLEEHALLNDDGICLARADQRVIRACLPMHTFGHPVDIDGILSVCERWNLALIEDAAESLGSFYKGRHTGTFGKLGVLSFNGNKIITTGGGGMILAGDDLGTRAKHLTTTAKKTHQYEYIHDEIGYNYRLPNLNAALGCAQLENLKDFLNNKRELAARYNEELKDSNLDFINEPENCLSNYWLNGVICEDLHHRDILLKETNEKNIMTRPIWALMNHLPMYANCLCGDLSNAEWLEARVVNLPSSVLSENFYD